MTSSRRCAACNARYTPRFSSASIGAPSSIELNPTMEFSGVRSSWDNVASVDELKTWPRDCAAAAVTMRDICPRRSSMADASVMTSSATSCVALLARSTLMNEPTRKTDECTSLAPMSQPEMSSWATAGDTAPMADRHQTVGKAAQMTWVYARTWRSRTVSSTCIARAMARSNSLCCVYMTHMKQAVDAANQRYQKGAHVANQPVTTMATSTTMVGSTVVTGSLASCATSMINAGVVKHHCM